MQISKKEDIYDVGILHYNILIAMCGSCAFSNAIPTQRHRNRLFRAVSYCMYNTEERYSEIR